jgi:hypothetical protein
VCSNAEEYWKSENVAETTPGLRDRAVWWLTGSRYNWSSPSDLQNNRGQVNPNQNDYHFDRMEIITSFWILDIPGWWFQPEEMQSKYSDLPNVAHDMFPKQTHGATVENRLYVVRDVIHWR